MNALGMIKKLQMAINLKHNDTLVLNQNQFYSFQQDRCVNMYSICRAEKISGFKSKNVELYRSANPVKVVFFLRDLLFIYDGSELPINDEKWNAERRELIKNGKYRKSK